MDINIIANSDCDILSTNKLSFYNLNEGSLKKLRNEKRFFLTLCNPTKLKLFFEIFVLQNTIKLRIT